MSFRQVIISEALKVSIKNSNINIAKKEDENIIIPIEDVYIILIEDNKTLITTQFLSKCADNKISVIICNEYHDPHVICSGYNTHYRQLHVLRMQLSLSECLKSNLWKELIETKIRNQYEVVKLTSNIKDDLEMLKEYYKTVELNDITNREGIAAKVFFKSLYGSEFIRFYDDTVNGALNFGYKIVASAISRELVSLGIDPKLGIWHDSKTNTLNLAYDLIEPFRPIVDYFIYEHLHLLVQEIPIKIRRDLVNILNVRMELSGKMQTLQNCIGYMVKSYLNILEGKTRTLIFPKIKKVEFIINE